MLQGTVVWVKSEVLIVVLSSWSAVGLDKK